MMDEQTARIIKALNDVTEPSARFKLIKEELRSIARDRKFLEMEEMEGEPIIILRRANRGGKPSNTRIFAINIDVMYRKSKDIKFKERGENIRGKNITKNYIIARTLHAIRELDEKDAEKGTTVLFYCWIPSFSKLEKLVGSIINTESPIWIMEPTSFYLCPVEKGFGKLHVVLNLPAELQSKLNDVYSEIKEKLEEIYKPSHDIYPMEGIPQIVNAFLPGASRVKLFDSDIETTRDTSTISFEIEYTFLPFDDAFLDGLIDNLDTITGQIDDRIEIHHETAFHFPGAKSSIDHDFFEKAREAHHRATGKEPYIDWHVHKSIASVLYTLSPEYQFFIYGPGNPFLLGERKETLAKKQAETFNAILAMLISPGGDG